MDPELKKAMDDLAKAWAEYRKTNDERIAALEKGQGVAEIEARLAKIDADVAKNQKLVEDLGKLEAKVNRMNLASGDRHGAPVQSEAMKAFDTWARKGAEREFSAALTTDYDPGAGYVVVPEIEAAIDRVAMKGTAMRRLATVRKGNASSYVKLVSKGGAGGGWVDEKATRSETTPPGMDKIEVFAREMYADPKASQTLLEDDSTDIAAWLAEEAGITFEELEDAAFVSGSGMATPRGILSYDIVANGSYAWGKLGYIASGGAGAWAAADPADKLIDLVHALKAKYRGNGAFLMNDLTLASVRKLKATTGAGSMNSYLWEPSFQPGVPGSLIGFPVESSDAMPDIAANSYSIAFGDFARGYLIYDRLGVSVLKDPYTNKGFVEFYTRKRVGGGVQNFEAIKLLKFAAS
jgi:HK97 family phage major capsid protein